MIRYFSTCLSAVLVFAPFVRAADPTASPKDLSLPALEKRFDSPADEEKPWAYWWWVNGNVTEQSITRDLEEMKEKGFGGLLMFDSRNYHDDILPPPPPRMEYMSPEWRKLLHFSIAEADRLGLKMSINLSSGAGALLGPWDVGDNAPKKLIWKSAGIRGAQRITCRLEPAAGCHEVAIVAARMEGAEEKDDASNNGEVRFSGEWQEVREELKPGPKAVEVIDLTGKADDQGNLAWDAPEGRWTLIRFAWAVMEGHEKDVDILSAAAVEEYFGRLGKAFLEEAGPAAGRTLRRLYSVSWEGAVPTWTTGLEDEFEKYSGYRMTPYLPVLAGLAVDDGKTSQRFQRDYYKTLGECFMDNCYGKLHELTNREGLEWHSESGGPWQRNLPSFRYADQLAFLARNDVPQGEFWVPKYRGLNRPPAMAAHIYGKRLAATEAFTHMHPHWTVYPAVLKPCADAAFCDGINQFIWHTFTASPKEYGKPGIEYFAGSHMNPNVTWWEQSGAFLRYLARCQAMLRQGRFVADVCCYTGDKPYLHWGRSEKWSEQATLSLEKGYTYDLVNDEVLLERLSVKDGGLVLPDGMSYRLLVVDLEDETASPEALRKIGELAKAGATVVLGQRRPERTPGLRGYPGGDEEVGRLASELWGDDAKASATRAVGEGRVITGTPLDKVLEAQAIAADFEGPFEYNHRRAEGCDLYFLSGEGQADCVFRAGGEPEFWCPVAGQTRPAAFFSKTEDGRTIVPVRLPKNGSVFVVFRSVDGAGPGHLRGTPPEGLKVTGRIEGGLRAQLWREGSFPLETSQGGQIEVAAGGIPPANELTGPWNLAFTPGWGAPETAVFDKLIPWNEHSDQGIRHYSGAATYRKSFDLTEAQAKGLVRLELGEVHEIAEVRINGKPMGVIWTDPWTVELTGEVKAGKNELEIDVANLWVNRLIADAALSDDKRLTGTNALRRDDSAKRPHLRGYSPKEPLLPSGLVGPVRLVFGVERDVKF